MTTNARMSSIKQTTSWKTIRGLIAAITIAALALVSPAAAPVHAAGLRN